MGGLLAVGMVLAPVTAAAQADRYRVDAATGSLVPDLRSAAAIIFDPRSSTVLWEENAQERRSIASLTKLMTAVVVLEGNRDLDDEVLITRQDLRRASTTYLRSGERVTVDDLLHLLLIPSDNAAARALARTSPGGAEGFVQRMNDKAEELGLLSTTYVDSSGLSSDNVSSAYDMARLISLVANDEKIAGIMQMASYSFRTSHRRVNVRSTNQLVRQGELDVLGGKTGFIRAAGYCLATLLRLPNDGPEVAVVILGAKSSRNRFGDARLLFEWFAQNARSLFSTALAGDG